MTWLMPSTSMPRAAMSVATSVRTLPLRKSASTRSRWPCDLLPWIASARDAALVEAAHHLVGAVLGAGEHQRAVDRLGAQEVGERSFGLPPRSTWMTRCAMRSTVVAAGVTATVAGSFSICLARSAMSCGMVAENSSVCRSCGSFATIFRMSWMKPMSSMRSASSSTNTSTPLSRTALLCTRSSRRPGVATSTSTPLSSERTCWPIETPPMASADWMRRWRP